MIEDSASGPGRRTFLAGTGVAGTGVVLGHLQSEGQSEPTVDREVICGFHADRSFSEMSARVGAELPDPATRIWTNRRLNGAAWDIGRPVEQSGMAEYVEQLAQLSGVRWAEQNFEMAAFAVDDPLFEQQYAPRLVDAPAVWEQNRLGSDGVTIGVVDTGVDFRHESLFDQFGDRLGQDFVSGGSTPAPSRRREQHGTHVAGIAAGTTDDGTGIAGISNAELLAARAIGERGRGRVTAIAAGIEFVARQGADLINLSLGSRRRSRLIGEAISFARNRGALVIAAAGNDGRNPPAFPARRNGVLAVGSIDPDETRSAFSNFGEELDLVAPGSGVISSVPENRYRRLSGTSMAAPVVTGVAALALSANPDLSSTELRAALTASARDLGLDASEQGNGCVDAEALVEQVEKRADPGTSAGAADSCGGESTGGSVLSYMQGGDTGERYLYTMRTEDPCQVAIDLVGPDRANFDLFVTLDGRRPTPTDADLRATTTNAVETVVLDEATAGQTISVLVDRVSGAGNYELAIRELGQ